MNLRIFSRKHGVYTNDPAWPSNQRTWSEWAIAPEGAILEIIVYDGSGPFVEKHDPRDFIVEPWTGFFDSTGKKIYRGDILKMESMFTFVSEVTWKEGAFWLNALDNEGYDAQFNGAYSKDWTIIGNINNNNEAP